MGSHPPAPLELADVTRRFGRVTALSRVSLVVPRGAVVALVGPNGSGKSTLIGLAAGLVAPDSGSVLVAGAPAGAVAAARSAALVPDDPSGLDELTVAEYLELVGALHGLGCPARRGEVSKTLGLAPLHAARLGSLSRGQRRRVSLAAALALDAPLVLVDEATEALDAATVLALEHELARAAARGAGVLVASHDATFVAAVCDTVVRLECGSVVEVSRGRRERPELDREPAAV